ncbi:ComF family protein [Virgibacillus dakarensis]|nr:ComF family protein [Virgibacillus dakarensis]
MQCLWCNQQTIAEMNWSTLLFLSRPASICKACEQKLEKLTGKRCARCSRMCEENVCADCKWWETHSKERDALTSNYSVFAYNEAIQDMVTKWKYRGDYCLGNIFKSHFHQAFKQHFHFLPKHTIAVPIPLSEERLLERGFNQAKMLADFIPLKQAETVARIHGEKQSKKTRKERLNTKNPFIITKKVNKPVLLVDDIYTTGTTLRHAARLLKQNGCPDVYSFTLIRG